MLPDRPINYALGRPAYQSSTREYGDAAFAVDGNITTSSHSLEEQFPYLVVDLQKPIWVTSAALTNRDNMYCKPILFVTQPKLHDV